jgi:hypothetical protein
MAFLTHLKGILLSSEGLLVIPMRIDANCPEGLFGFYG